MIRKNFCPTVLFVFSFSLTSNNKCFNSKRCWLRAFDSMLSLIVLLKKDRREGSKRRIEEKIVPSNLNRFGPSIETYSTIRFFDYFGSILDRFAFAVHWLLLCFLWDFSTILLAQNCLLSWSICQRHLLRSWVSKPLKSLLHRTETINKDKLHRNK